MQTIEAPQIPCIRISLNFWHHQLRSEKIVFLVPEPFHGRRYTVRLDRLDTEQQTLVCSRTIDRLRARWQHQSGLDAHGGVHPCGYDDQAGDVVNVGDFSRRAQDQLCHSGRQ